MSTTFTTPQGEWVGVRWNGGRERGVCFDVGRNRDRVRQIEQSCLNGQTFVSETSDELSGVEFLEVLCSGTLTFGEFGGTMSLGSGSLSTFEGF